ncbi:hypothetical protein IJG93_01910 [Candidatus Saccharibacteria bacterium]|nr:hypothetical protein [Candidatus Saccharibacteria bacterium]
MKTKKGAAAFYIVAFSTLILVVIATSFAMVVMSEMTRTMNDDLSQSAYDSALAGVEDAKVAFANYQRCVEAGIDTGDCGKIRSIMANPSCNMVWKMLYYLDKSDDQIPTEMVVGGVETASGSGETTTNQAYTCVKILTELVDYRASLGSKTGKYVDTIRAGVKDGGSNTVDKIKISWYLGKGVNPVAWNNVSGFPTADFIAVPPTLEVQLVQTAETFNLSDFDVTEPGKTNRATLYLVPTKESGVTEITADEVVKRNDHYVSNHPFMINCVDPDNPPATGLPEFLCSATIDLPRAIGSSDTAYRANDTFLISISIPYRDPDTDFALELICSDGSGCDGKIASDVDGHSTDRTVLKNTQIAIESTGRANDLVRRVETRLQTKDETFGMGQQSPYYALQILGDSGVTKNMTVTKEGTAAFRF